MSYRSSGSGFNGSVVGRSSELEDEVEMDDREDRSRRGRNGGPREEEG